MVSPPSITLHLISYSISLYQLANSTLLFSIFVHLFCFCSLFWLHSGLVCIPSASCMSLSNCPHHTIHSFTLLLIHLCCKVINNNNNNNIYQLLPVVLERLQQQLKSGKSGSTHTSTNATFSSRSPSRPQGSLVQRRWNF